MHLLTRFLLLLPLGVMFSCSGRQQERFVAKYSDADFTAFTNRGVFFRGRDKEHLLILFVDNDLSKKGNEGPFIVYVKENLKSVVKTSTDLMTDTINIDKASLQRLAIRFLSYDVKSLKVDTNGNVFIGLLNNERPDLVRFSDEKYRTAYYRQGWSKVKGNWYKMEE